MLVCSGVLYSYYALALKNNSFHHWNKRFILLAVIACLFIPTLQFAMNVAPAPSQQLNMIVVCAYVTKNVQQAGIDFSSWLPGGIYIFIALLLLLNMVRNWMQVKRLARGGQKTQFEGYQLITHPQVKSTFSFFHNIFWSEDLSHESPEGRQILKHELEHVRAGHTGEKLFMQVICCICWFNPFFYLLKKELTMVHEFLADKAATKEEAREDYARTLLQATLQTRLPLLINSFGQAPVKRRILMLFNHHSSHSLIKKIIIFPLVLALGFAIGCQQDLDLDTKNIIDPTTVATQAAKHAEVYTFVSDPPNFPGGEEALARYLSQTIRYPKEARERNITGTVFVNFVVDPQGNVTQAKTVGAVKGGGLEQESVRVVAAMPKWNPGRQEGKAVSVAFNLPIKYALVE
jgi:TonB family protein